MIMRSFFAIALLVALPVASQACLNDSDSDALAVQNKRLPDALRVISGRFERNPPRYYQMRIARVTGELQRTPRQFGLYDDLAVAHDRLGDDVAAMQVMAQKRSMLPAFDATDKENKEAWYRYYANDGTFRAHHFLHEGAKVERLDKMKQAREEIERAIEIKPNAHFGREKYQLAVMDWIIACKTRKTKGSLASYLQQHFAWSDDWYSRHPLSKERQEAAEGLSGLIVLGAAWQSPDVFDALGGALESRSTIALSHLARKRCDEIQSAGVASLGTESIGSSVAEMTEMDAGLNSKNKATLDGFYPQLRQEADEWNASRAKWMEAKFAQGQHPDTDAKFWEGWKETPAPNLEQVRWWNARQGRFEDDIDPIFATLLKVLPIFAVAGFIAWFLKRRWSEPRETLGA